MGSLWVTNAVPLTQIAYAAGSITASYTVAGQFTSGVIIMSIVSTLDAAVQVSFDGVHDHIAVPAGSAEPVYLVYHFKNNYSVLPDPVIAVKRIGTPTTGNLYVSAFSAQTP